jgi:cell division protein FtsL
MKKNKKKSVMKMQSIQKKYITVGSVLLLCLWVVSFFSKITLSSINFEVEKLNKQVTKQEKTNQSLSMKINELASLENIQAVANNEGLAYNNNNIVIINNQ